MRLLILTNYFTPDLSAGSFRMQALVDALAQSNSDSGLSVDLITTCPNRYASLAVEAPEYEDCSWLRIHRLKVPSHSGGMAEQAKAYLHYANGVRRIAYGKQWDLVFATSSRLATAALGAAIARRARAPLYLDIRDLFTENMDELLAGGPMAGLRPFIRHVERRTFRMAAHINVVSQGFLPHIKAIAPSVPISVRTNGIDDIFADADFTSRSPGPGLPLIVYAGNMGEGQGLHRVIPQIAKRLDGVARFRLIGDGGRRKALEEAIVAAGIENVELLPPVPRGELIEQYRSADVLFLHLNDLKSFRKVLPSKLFEYGATGRPIVAGVAGYPAEFLEENVPGTQVCRPLDIDGLSRAIRHSLDMPRSLDRGHFCTDFDRKRVMQLMQQEILRVAEKAAASQ